MISASSSSALRVARRLVVEPLVCLEHHRIWTASLSQQQQRGYAEGPASEQPGRKPPQPVSTTSRLGPRKNRPLSNPKIKTETPGGNSERPKKFLEPYVLSRRLIGLASQGRLYDAAAMLQNSPSNAPNVKTWNTLLLHCMKKKHFKLGFKLFTDVRLPFALG